jgi:hypothetical protein
MARALWLLMPEIFVVPGAIQCPQKHHTECHKVDFCVLTLLMASLYAYHRGNITCTVLVDPKRLCNPDASHER